MGFARSAIVPPSSDAPWNDAASRHTPPQPSPEGREDAPHRPWDRPDGTASIRTDRALRKRLTPQEAKLWLRLRALRPQGFHFRRQVPIGPFVVEFACLRAELVVEVDGGQHSADLNVARDHRRDEALAASGFRVLRFWNPEINVDPNAVADTIFACLTDTQS